MAAPPSDSSTSAREPPLDGADARMSSDSAAGKASVSAAGKASVSPIVNLPDAQGTAGADASVPTSAEKLEDADEAPPNGLQDQTNFLPTKQVITVFLGLSVALACAFLEQTIVATALPRITSELGSEAGESSWVTTVYLLTSLAFTPIYGRWSDIFGRKVVLICSLSVFFAFSLACALSQTMIQLIVFRAFQGIGGGAIITMVLIIVSDIVSLKDRGKFQGINEAVIALSNGIGPILGGVFSQYTTWRWAFWINLPLGGAAIIVSLWLLPLRSVSGDMREKLLRIDYVGSALTVASSVLILLALSWRAGGVSYSWASAPVLTPLFLGFTVFGAFVLWEAKFAKLPIIPMSIFKYKTVTGVYIATAMNGMTFFAILYYVPQFFQLVRGDSPVKSSLLLLPFLAPIACFVFLAGQITSRTGQYKWMIVGGCAVWSAAQGLQSTIDTQSSTGKIVGSLLMAGIASGFTFQTSLIAAQAAVPRHEMAVVTGTRNFVRLFGSTIALAIGGALVNNELRATLANLRLPAALAQTLLDDPTAVNNSKVAAALTSAQRASLVDGYLRGFRSVFYMTVACQLLAFVASLLLIGQHNLNRDDDRAQKDRSRAMLRAREEKRRAWHARGDADVEVAEGEHEDQKRDAAHEDTPRVSGGEDDKRQ